MILVLSGCSGMGRVDYETNPFASDETSKILASSKADSTELKLLYSNNIQGEIGTCGCAFSPVGGVDRRLNYLNSLQGASSDFVHLDSGSALFSTLVLTANTKKKQRAVAEAIAQAYSMLSLSALNVGRYDLVEGHEFYMAQMKKHKLPSISTNLIDRNSKHPFPTSKTIKTKSGVTLKILGFSSVSREIIPGLELRPENPMEALARETKGLAKDVLLVVLSDLSSIENEEMTDNMDRPFLILGSTSFDSFAYPLHKKTAAIGQTVAQGQEIGVLDVFWPKNGEGRWLNQSGLTSFNQRWERLKQEREFLLNQEESEFLEEEKSRNQEAFVSLQKYAPVSSRQHIVYQAKLVTMDKNWTKKNKLSSLVKRHKK